MATQAEVMEVLEQFRHLFAAKRNIQRPHLVAAQSAMERLCWLCELAAEERAFVLDAFKKPRDYVGLSIFADYLKDMQRDADALVVERISPQTGDLLAVHLPAHMAYNEERSIVRGVNKVVKDLAERGRRLVAIILPHGTTLETVTEAQARCAGWRKNEEVSAVYEDLRRELRGEGEEGSHVLDGALALIRRLKREIAGFAG